MKNNRLLTFTYIVNFRGGTYCSQVQAESVNNSVIGWIEKIAEEQNEIKFLGDKIIKELKELSIKNDYNPILLTGLKNSWCVHYPTRQGSFSINIIQTETI